MWFSQKKFELFINDKVLEGNVREQSYDYFFQLFMQNDGRFTKIDELIT